MHGLQEIRKMNDPTTTTERYQAQWKGDGWCVFDSHTSGWGSSYATARDCQQACDALNAE
jgi:hypothetical protein